MRQSLVTAFGAVVMSMGSLVVPASVTTVSASVETAESAPSVDRLGGANRYGTSVSVSQSAWTSANTDVIYLARGDVLADALSAGTLRGGPILLTRTDTLPPGVDAEISRLGNKPVIVLGGPNAVNDNVAQLASRGAPYERLSGPNREATSAAISEYAFPTSNTAYVTESQGTNGQGSPDAVAGGALSDGPILLVNGTAGATQEVQDEIARLGATNVIQLGGNPLRTPVTGTVSGNDRYETATLIASLAFGEPSTVYLARGDVFADAVSAGSLTDGPVVLTRTTKMPGVTCDWLTTNKPSRIVAIGSTNAVSATVLSRAQQCAEDTTAPALGDLPRVPWSGGPTYFARFPVAKAAGWTDPSVFPISVFFGKPSHTTQLLDVGVNTFMGAEHDGSNLTDITDHGMHVRATGMVPR